MNASYRTNAPMARPATTPLIQQPPMMFLFGLIGITLLAGCVALIVLSIKLGSGASTMQVARAEVPPPAAAKPTVITQVPRTTPPAATVPIPAEADDEPDVPKVVAPVSAEDGQNPWQLATPNVLGVAVRGHTAVLVDAVEQSEPFLPVVLDAVASGLSHEQADTTASVFYIHNDQIVAFPGNPAAVGPETAEALRVFQQSITAAGRRGFWEGYTAGARSGAGQVVIITGRKSWDTSIPLLNEKLAAQGAPLVTFVHIDADVPSLRDALLDASGGYRPISVDQLNAWHDAAK